MATTKAQRKLFFNLRSAKRRLAWLTNNEAEAIAQDLGVDVKQVLEMEQRLSARDTAFDVPEDSDEDSSYQAPALYLEDHRADPAWQLEQSDSEEDNHGRMVKALAELDDRSRDIINSRWLMDDKATLHDLADKYGISAERVRQLEQNAMKKVRATMEA